MDEKDKEFEEEWNRFTGSDPDGVKWIARYFWNKGWLASRRLLREEQAEDRRYAQI